MCWWWVGGADIRHQTSDRRHQTADGRVQASGIRLKTSGPRRVLGGYRVGGFASTTLFLCLSVPLSLSPRPVPISPSHSDPLLTP